MFVSFHTNKMGRLMDFVALAAVVTISTLYLIGSVLLRDDPADYHLKFDRDDNSFIRPSILSLVGLTHSEAPENYPPLHAGEFRTMDYPNIVVIPDIHGDAKNFIISLWIAVRDVENSSISLESFERLIHAGAALGEYPESPMFPDTQNIAVSLGDLVDRGPDSILCLRILWSIERVIGWPLVSLYGNHEIMSHSAYADRYIHPNEVSELGSLSKRNEIFARSSPLWKKMASSGLLMGRFKGPDSKPSTSRLGVLFNHAGPEPNFIARVPEHVADSIHLMNQMAQLAVTANDTSGDRWLSLLMNNEQSPIWSRVLTNDQMDQKVLCDEILPVVLERYGVGRLVLGHTPQYDHRMKSLCRGRIILADCAVSKYMAEDEGQPAVLIMKTGGGQETGHDEFDEVYALYYSFESRNYSKQTLVNRPPIAATTTPSPLMRRSPRLADLQELASGWTDDDVTEALASLGYDDLDDLSGEE